MTNWVVVRLQGGLGDHAAQWDRLNQRDFGGNVYLSSRFVEGLLRNFSDGTEYLCLHLVDSEADSMCILQKRGPFAWASFLPTQTQLAPTLVRNADALKSLFRKLSPWTFQISLLCNDPDLVAGRIQDTALLRRFDHALTISVALGETFAQYWAARPSNLRSNLRRYDMRVTSANIEQRFVRIADLAAIPAAIDRYAALEATGWKGRQGTAVGSDEHQQRFYHDLIQRFAHVGKAAVYELWFDDKLAASRLVLREGHTHVMLKTTYDEQFGAYAPGRLLLRAVIEDMFASGAVGSIEFYTDANRSQLEWATSSRWIRHYAVFHGRLSQLFIDIINAMRRKPRLRSIDAHRQPSQTVGVSATAHPDQLSDSARRLMARAERRNIGLGYKWYRNLVNTVYPQDPHVRFYSLTEGAECRAVLPVRAEKIRFGWRLESLSNFYTSLYEPIVESGLKGRQLVPLLSTLARDYPGVSSLKFAPMDPDSHAYVMLRDAIRMSRWFAFEYFAFGNWYHPVTGNWSDYLASRSGTVRSTIKRMGKKFLADGGRLELVTEGDGLRPAITAYEQVYSRSWKVPEPFPDFMPGLLQDCAERGALRLGLAWLDGRPIAAQAWIVADGRAEIYKLAYDEEFKSYSPGTLITAMLMERVIDVDKVSEIDYLIGDDPYKKMWMSSRRERWGIVAYDPRSLRGLLGLLYELAGRLVKYWRVRLKPAATQAPHG